MDNNGDPNRTTDFKNIGMIPLISNDVKHLAVAVDEIKIKIDGYNGVVEKVNMHDWIIKVVVGTGIAQVAGIATLIIILLVKKFGG